MAQNSCAIIWGCLAIIENQTLGGYGKVPRDSLSRISYYARILWKGTF